MSPTRLFHFRAAPIQAPAERACLVPPEVTAPASRSGDSRRRWTHPADRQCRHPAQPTLPFVVDRLISPSRRRSAMVSAIGLAVVAKNRGEAGCGIRSGWCVRSRAPARAIPAAEARGDATLSTDRRRSRRRRRRPHVGFKPARENDRRPAGRRRQGRIGLRAARSSATPRGKHLHLVFNSTKCYMK